MHICKFYLFYTTLAKHLCYSFFSYSINHINEHLFSIISLTWRERIEIVSRLKGWRCEFSFMLKKMLRWWCGEKTEKSPKVENLTNLKEKSIYLRDWPVMMCDPSPGNFLAHFLFNTKIKTTYPGVLPPISSFALRPKLGLWWSK